ncbi:MAG TPA: CBS domain-containing protein [Planctomycetota bacterium]|nr:CBS domain-containing protein [Planctomycetota bacterium]
MKVQDIMNMSLSTCSAHDRLDAAAARMWEHDCGCLPVVDHDGRPMAMITDRDLCMAAFTTGKRLADLPVAHAMSKQLVSCRPQEDVAVAAQRMCKHGVRRIPVVDAAGKLMGLLSLNDLAAAMAEGPATKTANIAANEALRVLAAVSRHRSKVPAAAEPPAPTPPSRPVAQPQAAAAKGTSV